MRRILALVVFLMVFQNCSSQKQDDEIGLVKKMDSLLTTKSFFKASELFGKNENTFSNFQTLRYTAILHNLFHEPIKSNAAIDSLFASFAAHIEDEEAKDLLETKLSNSIKLYDYKTADSITDVLINDYKNVYDAEGLWDVKNNGIIWKAVKDFPIQETIINDSSSIKLFRDKAGLKNLNAQVSENKFPFIFDTGANLSVVIESQAQEMDLDIIDKQVSVNTITGQRVNARIGVAKSFSINNIDFKNVVFLVFPDKALYVPQIDYQIKGILGFPVLSAMKEVHFMSNDIIFVPNYSRLDKPKNLAIQYLTPYVNLKLKDEKWYLFAFDTGANTTFLYKPYYDEHQDLVNSHYDLTDINFAGGGGSLTVKGYIIPLQITYEDTTIELKDISLIPNQIEGTNQFEYGNLGQDFISRFKTMVINFEKMFVHFE